MPRFQGIPIDEEKKPRFAGVPVDEPDDNFSVGEMVKNIPGSAAKLASDITYPIRHPIKTGKAVAGLAEGVIDKGAESLASSLPEGVTTSINKLNNALVDMGIPLTRLPEDGGKIRFDDSEKAEQVLELLAQRYGSKEAALNTLESDPVGVLADVAGLATGAGALTKSKTLTKAGAAVNPINVAANTAKVTAGKLVPKNLPKNMYESVAKFSTTLPEKKRAAMVDTAIKHRIMPTVKGTDKLQRMIDGLNTSLDELIIKAKGEIPRQAVYKHLKDLRQQKGGVRLDAPGDLDAINNITRNFELHLKALGKDKLTAADLQKLKTETYKSINWDAQRMTGTPIKESTYKAIARGAKEGVEQLEPGVKAVNQQLSELYELQPSLARSARRIENRNFVPIDVPLQIGAGSSVGPAAAAIGTATSIAGIPKIKATTALKLQDLAESATLSQFLKNNPNISALELAMILAGRQAKETNQTEP